MLAALVGTFLYMVLISIDGIGQAWRVQLFGRQMSYSDRPRSHDNSTRAPYCCGTCVGVPPNQPAAYPITSNTTITAATLYQRRLSMKFIVTSSYPAAWRPGVFFEALAVVPATGDPSASSKHRVDQVRIFEKRAGISAVPTQPEPGVAHAHVDRPTPDGFPDEPARLQSRAFLANANYLQIA